MTENHINSGPDCLRNERCLTIQILSVLYWREHFTSPPFYLSCTGMQDSSWSLLHDAALQTLQYSSVCQDWRPPECTILILTHWETKKSSGKPWWRRCCKMCFLSALQYDWRALGRTASHHWRSESFQTAEPEHLKGRENWIFPQTVPTYCLSGRSCSRKKLHEVWPGLWGPAHSGRSLDLPAHTIQSQSAEITAKQHELSYAGANFIICEI